MKTPKQEADELISLFYGVMDKEIDSGANFGINTIAQWKPNYLDS